MPWGRLHACCAAPFGSWSKRRPAGRQTPAPRPPTAAAAAGWRSTLLQGSMGGERLGGWLARRQGSLCGGRASRTCKRRSKRLGHTCTEVSTHQPNRQQATCGWCKEGTFAGAADSHVSLLLFVSFGHPPDSRILKNLRVVVTRVLMREPKRLMVAKMKSWPTAPHRQKSRMSQPACVGGCSWAGV